MKTVKNNPKQKPFSIEFICNGFLLKRDAFYKYHKRYIKNKQLENQVIKLVNQRGMASASRAGRIGGGRSTP